MLLSVFLTHIIVLSRAIADSGHMTFELCKAHPLLVAVRSQEEGHVPGAEEEPGSWKEQQS